MAQDVRRFIVKKVDFAEGEASGFRVETVLELSH